MATKIKIVKSGDPNKGTLTEEKVTLKGRGPIEDTADIRDIITGLVGKGYTALSDDDVRGGYGRLQTLVGRPKAQKLMEQIFIYNQRPENRGLPVEDRISRFYDAGSGDAATNDVIGKAKSFGYGVLPGFRNSPNVLNQGLLGKIPVTAQLNPNEELKRKIMLKVGK